MICTKVFIITPCYEFFNIIRTLRSRHAFSQAFEEQLTEIILQINENANSCRVINKFTKLKILAHIIETNNRSSLTHLVSSF